MKKLFVFLMFLSLCPFLFAQNITVKQNTFQKVALSIATENVSVEEISVSEGDFSLVSLEGYGPSNNPGAPELPVLVKYLQIPVCESVVATVTDAQYTEYSAAELGITHPLYPNQPSVSKSAVKPPFSYDNTVYTTDEFYALPLVSVEKVGIQRDMALANIYVSPVQYNPVTQRVRVYSRIDVEFTFVNANIAQTQQLQKYASPMFAWDNKMLLNEMPNPAKTQPEFANSPIKYLIVANSMFSGDSDLEAFANWKRRLGYKVEIAYTSDASVGTTTTSIKSFIQNKYDNATTADPAPTFLLLIGDVAQIPAFSGTELNTHATDLYYATLAGSDNIPDCYYGRLSATNATQLKNQLDKIMMYEQYTMPDPSYLGKAILIAGTDDSWSPTHADGQINYAYDNYVNTSSTTHNYTTVYKHNYDCTNDAATIRNEVSAGAGWVNYTAHGSSSGWYSPSFTTSHVSSLTNTNKYGLLIGNCCQTGTFDESECFAEAVLRAQNKGAMGYIGASQVTYWNEDVYWSVGVRSSITASMSYDASNLGMYDKLFHTHNEAQSVWVSTIGGILYGGNQAVQASSSSKKLYYWEIYHCFGDPSVRIYLGMPNTMTVTADDITLGEDQYQVQAVPYAYVALKKNTTEFVAAAFANASGLATLALPSDLEPGTLELVVLAQNYIPYFQDVEVIEEGGCISPNGLAVSNVTPFTANLSWNSSATSGVFNIELKAGNADWTTVATGITATSYALTNLQDDVEYKARVQSVCGGETSSWRTVTFTTPVACPIPTEVTCTAFTATTATLAWTENGSATTWVLQYGTNSNFTSGTYTQVTVNGNPTKTLTGLTAETTYYARVRANCGGEYGNSQWSATGTFMPSAVQTFEIGGGGTTNNTYLPSYSWYNYGFSQQIYTSEEIGTAGTIKSIAFKNTGETKTRTYSVYLTQAEKETFSGTSDWVTVSSSDLVFTGSLTFTAGEWTKINFTTPFEYDGESNLIVTVADNTGSYSSSPHMACLVFNATNQAIYAYSDGSAYTISSPGTANSVASVKNQIKMDIVPASGTTCAKPKNLAVSDLTVTSATLSWTAVGAVTNWVLQYGTNSNFTSGTYTEVTVTGTPTKSLTDLTTGTTYYARVKAVCDVENESSWSVTCSFTPSNSQTACEDFESYNGTAYNVAGVLPTGWNVIFTGSSSEYSPHVATGIYNGYVISSGNGFCFTSGSSNYGTDNYAILPTYEGTLESISFDYRYESSSNGTLYLGYITNISDASTFTSLQTVPASTTQGTSVSYSLIGSNIPENARLAFKWTYSSSYWTCGIDNVCVTTQMSLTPCDTVTSIAVEAAPTSATLTITGGSGLYNIEIKEGNANWASEASNVSGQSYTLTNLNDNMSYQVRVQSVCDGNVSDWVTASFSTPAACHAPTNLAVSEFDHQSAVLSWSGEADSWIVAYKTSNATQFTEVAVSTSSYTLTELLPETAYTVKVAAICGNETVWSEAINFTTSSLPCPAPTNVTVSNVGTESAVLTWTENGYATSWMVSYYPETQEANSSNIEVSQPTCTLTGLTEATSYVVTVRPVCDSGEESWSEPVVFTTEETPCFSIELNEENGFVWEEDFEDYTTSTVSSTGVEPTCWVLVQEDVPMSQSKKPQICYKSSYAHSGNYSLKLNYRGIYAMPNLSLPEEFTMSQVVMKMYLRQPNAVYQLEVGVLEENGTFVPVTLINNSTTDIEHVVCDFSSYTGNGHRIAFHNVLDNNVNISYSLNYIDDIVLSLPVCGAITLPYRETFEDITGVTTANTGVEPECWELVQEDVQMPEDKKPQLYYKSDFAHSGSYSLLLNYRGVYAMPAMAEDVSMQDVKLAMYLRQANAAYQLEVGVWDDTTNTFMPVALFNNATTGVEQVMCDFSGYTGNGRRIAFHNVLGNGKTWSYSYNYIDDITLTTQGSSAGCDGYISTLPYEENFEDFTESTTAATGVEPDCWELVMEEVQMPDNKKPQLYYRSDFAHSGDYSLLLNYRGVYAMPSLDATDADINDLHLSMYLRQPNTAYTLEVGVWEPNNDPEQNETGVFVPVHVFNNKTTDVTFVECDFSSYTGDGGRIAFRNTLSSGKTWSYSYNYLDDITLTLTEAKIAESSSANVIDAMDADRDMVDFVVYPNPTKDFVNVQCTMNNEPLEVKGIEVIDVYGKVVRTVVGANNYSPVPTQINVSGLAAGMYFVRVSTNEGVVTKQFVKR